MITAKEFFGGGDFLNASAGTGTHYLKTGLGRVQSWGGGNGLSLRLPDARGLTLGGPVFLIFNVGVTDLLTIRDVDGGFLRGVGDTDNACSVYLFDNSTAAGDWETDLHIYSNA